MIDLPRPVLFVLGAALVVGMPAMTMNDPKVWLDFLVAMAWPALATAVAVYLVTVDAQGRSPIERLSQVRIGDLELQLKARVDARLQALADFVEGASFHGDEQYDRARDRLQRAVQTDPTFALAWSELASVALDMRDAPLAIEASEKALALDGTDPDTLYNRAEAYWLDRRYAEGLIAADAALRVVRDDGGLSFVRALNLNDLGRTGDALAVLDRVLPLLAVRADGWDDAARYERALALARLDRRKEALQQLSEIDGAGDHFDQRERERWPEAVQGDPEFSAYCGAYAG